MPLILPKELQNMKILQNKIFTAILKIALSAGALIFVFTKIDIAEVTQIFGHSEPFLMILALILFVLSKYISAIRLNFFFTSAGLLLNKDNNLKLYLLGMFYNLFLPGGIGGDGYKIWLLNKHYKVKTQKIFWAVILDRLTGVMALFCLVVLLAPIIRIETSFNIKLYIWILIPFSLMGFYFVIKYFFNDFSNNYTITSILAFVVQTLQVFCAYAILRSLGGPEKELEYLFLFLISSIVATLPITNGGVGSREITFLYGSQILGLDQNLSIVLSLAFYIIMVFTSSWGIIYIIRRKVWNPELGVN